jgi:hypothetical protein
MEELDALKAKAKAMEDEVKEELVAEFNKKVEEVKVINDKYKAMFGVYIDDKVKGKRRAKGTGVSAVSPITKEEVNTYIDLRKAGGNSTDIKLDGRRGKTIQKITEAYDKAKKKDVDSVFALIEK